MPSKDKKTRRADNFGEEQRDGRELGNVAPFESDTCNDSTTESGHTSEQLSRVRSLSRDGDRWRYFDYPDVWEHFEEYAATCIECERLLSGNDLNTEAHRFEGVKLDRTLLPYFVRLLKSEHVELNVELRSSMFDLLVYRDGRSFKPLDWSHVQTDANDEEVGTDA